MTGSDISAVSSQFVNNNPSYFKKTPTLPVNRVKLSLLLGMFKLENR